MTCGAKRLRNGRATPQMAEANFGPSVSDEGDFHVLY
jgi:hypothetical protein